MLCGGVATLLPNWMMERYLLLWSTFKGKKFSFVSAQAAIKKSKYSKDSDAILSLFLSQLKRAGWLGIEVDPKDSRKRLYTLKPYEEAFKEVLQEIREKQR